MEYFVCVLVSVLSMATGESRISSDFTTMVYSGEGIGTSFENSRSINTNDSKSLLQPKKSSVLSLMEIKQLQSQSKSQHNSRFLQVLRRNLAIGDFESVNDLMQGVSISVDDISQETSFGFFAAKYSARNIRCTNLQIGDMLVDYEMDSDREEFEVTVTVPQLSFDVVMDYDWSLGFFGGTGEILVSAEKSSTSSVEVEFESDNFDTSLPKSTRSKNCKADINLSELQMTGSVSQVLLDWLKGSVEEMIMETIDGTNGVVCYEMTSLADGFANGMTEIFEEQIALNLLPIDSWRLDPSYPELQQQQMLEVTSSSQPQVEEIEWINFNDPNANALAELFVNAIESASSYFNSSLVSTANNNNLDINSLLRDYFLDGEGALVMNATNFPEDFDPVFFYSHDELTEASIILDTAKIMKLDTLSTFDASTDLGNRTYQLGLAWETITAEILLKVIVNPSTLPESMMKLDKAEPIIETMRINLQFDTLDFNIAMLLGADVKLMESLFLGSLLSIDDALECFYSIFRNLSVSGLDVSIGKIHQPILSGLTSPGTSRILGNALDAAFIMYEQVIMLSLPNMFQNSVRDSITGFLNNAISTALCPMPTIKDEFIDFRELFLAPADSISLGGAGDNRYGDILTFVHDFLDSQFSGSDEDGLSLINSNIIRPFTKSQSGVEGTLLFNTGASFNAAEGIMLNLTNASIINLDMVMPPVEMLEPIQDPYSLLNKLIFGPVIGRSLNATMNLQLFIPEGEESEPTFNEIDINLSVDSFNIVADIFAMMNSQNVMNFPLKDIFNIHCWLMTMHSKNEETTGKISTATSNRFRFNSFSTQIENFSTELICKNCTDSVTSIFDAISDFTNDRENDLVGMIAEDMVSMLGETLQSDVFATSIDRVLLDAPNYCPHSPKNIGIQDFEAVDFLDSVKNILPNITTDIISEVLKNFLGLDTDASPLEPMDSLSTEQLIEMVNIQSSGSSLIDWTDLDGTLSPTFGNIFTEARKFLSSSYVDQMRRKLDEVNGDSNMFALDEIINDFLGDSATVFFDDFKFEIASSVISVESITFGGLETLTEYNLLDPTGATTLGNSLSFGTLSLEIKISFVSDEGESPQESTLSIEAYDISASMALFMALDADAINSLELGGLMYSDNIFSCIMSSSVGAYIQKLNVEVGNIATPSFQGLDAELSELIVPLIEIIFETFRSTMLEVIPSIFDTFALPVANDILGVYQMGSTCENKLVSKMEENGEGNDAYVDFRDLFLSELDAIPYGGSGDAPYGNIFQLGLSVLQDLLQVDPNTGLSGINDLLIRPFTLLESNEAGTWYSDEELIDEGVRLIMGGSDITARLKLKNARIENIDSIGELFLMNPVSEQPHQINNTASIGVAGSPLRFSVDFYLSLLQINGTQIRNRASLRLDIHNAAIIVTALLKVAEDRFARLALGNLFYRDCWLATIPSIDFDSFNADLRESGPTAAIRFLSASFEQLDLQMNCTDCSSYRLNEWGEILSTPEAVDGITMAANQFIEFLSEKLQDDYIQAEVNNYLNDAAGRCAEGSRYEGEGPSYQLALDETSGFTIPDAIILVIVAACCCIVLAILMTTLRCIVRRRHRNYLMLLPKNELYTLFQQQKKEDEERKTLNDTTTSMFCSPAIPLFVRLFMPIVILANVACFLSGHLNIGATVRIILDLGGEELLIPNLFEFSMARSTIDLWEAGARELPILIFLFSGVWPYTKLLITFILWFLPPSAVSVATRGSILLWLDALAKWSMVDIFAFVVTLVSVRVSFASPKATFLPENLYSFDLLVVPLWGLYANMFAQVIAQVSSHFIIHYHRKIIFQSINERASGVNHSNAKDSQSLSSQDSMKRDHYAIGGGVAANSDDNAAQQKHRLCNHLFERQHRDGSKIFVRNYVHYVLSFIALLLNVVLILSCIFPSFSTEVFGIVGVFTEWGQDFNDAVFHHSVFSIVKEIIDEGTFLDSIKDSIGLALFSFLFIFTTLIVPIIQSIVLLVQWFLPMTDNTRNRVSILLEILQAWQYTEVFVVSIVVASWQLEPISTYLLNVYCESLDEGLRMISYLGIIGPEDVQCFQLKASVETSSYLFILSAILLALVNTFVIKANRQYCREKLSKESNNKTLSTSPQEQGSVKTSTQQAEAWWKETGDEDVNIIQLQPVLFSDTFRWCLLSDNNIQSLGTNPLSTDEHDVN